MTRDWPGGKLRLLCDLRLLPPSAGGRSLPLRSGWRGIAWFGERYTEQDADLWPPIPLGEEVLWGCEIRLAGTESLAPGDCAEATLTFLFLEEARPAMRPGARFEIREGNRPVGSGIVRDLTR